MTLMLVLLLGMLGLTPAASAQEPASPEPADASVSESADVAEDSPRVSLERYLELCRQRRFAEAARYLDVSAQPSADPAELARRLKAVLDRHLWIDLDVVSELSGGDAQDELPPHVEQVGTIPSDGEREEPVRLVRSEDPNRPHWVFSQGTVARIDKWYAALGDRWIRESLPGVLLRPGPRELLRWQWLALPVLALLAWGLGRLASSLTRALTGRLFARTRTDWDDALLERLGAPLTFAWALAAAYLLLPWLALNPPAERFVGQALGAGGVVTLFWALWRTVDVTGEMLRHSSWGKGNPSAQSVILVGRRIGRVAVFGLGVVAALSHLGYPAASLLAGLGLGGLALALAAQKTVENLFGSLALAADQPIRVGDFVRVEDFVGTVESIGLRSTRIRTLDRTLISMPNARLADMRLESFTARDRMRLACIVGVVYGTTAAQMREVLSGLEAVLRGHPKIWPDAVVVRFKEFGASSLDIEIMAWFQTPVWAEFQLIRQEVLLQFMEVVERAGTSFAFPTRTVHLVNEPAPAT